MPRVAYSEEERAQIREKLIMEGLALMAKQGIQHTTVEQIYRQAGISRTFFYSFFPTKEDFVLETLYYQQPKIIAYAKSLMADPALSWRQAVEQFFLTCCYGEKNGIAVLSIEEQTLLFRRLSKESEQLFRKKQTDLFCQILESFGIPVDLRKVGVVVNLCLTVLIIRRAIPDTLPFFVLTAADETVQVQVRSLVDYLEQQKRADR